MYSQPSFLDSIHFTILLWYLLFLFVIIGILRAIGKKPDITDHWYHLFEDGQFSSYDVYQTLIAAFQEKKIPHFYCENATKSEGGLFHDNREYLIVSYTTTSYILCAAPFGTSFFISWRAGQTRGFLQRMMGSIPLIGKAIEQLFFKQTYYHEDSNLMFQDTIHTTVLKIVDAMALEKGIRGPVELQRKPIMAKR